MLVKIVLSGAFAVRSEELADVGDGFPAPLYLSHLGVPAPVQDFNLISILNIPIRYLQLCWKFDTIL